ncbi:MAG TPA: response regulator [Candidatus Acidoferrales bacterium]|nr:response regulator [Candidatus Acidoferrales bacterium]
MVYLITASGHEALEAHEGAEGLQKAKLESPDLILLDIHMPQMDGYEVARRLRADPDCSRIPLVAVTALAMVGDREKILASGFNGYIAKPIEAQFFLSQINAFLAAPAQRPAAAAVAEQASQQLTALQSKKLALVLFVDNTQTNIDLVRGILEPSGYEVAAALSAQEGLELARRMRPDLILSDVHMPHEDGYSFMRMVQKDPCLRPIPFVFLSASVWSAREKRQALELGASKFLSRPIEPLVLLEEIQGCLQKARGA